MSREFFDSLVSRVRDAHPERDPANAARRIIKLIEECGELAQAYLSATSSTSKKGKTWADVQEEASDCFVVSVDIFLAEGFPINRLYVTRTETSTIPICIGEISHASGAALSDVSNGLKGDLDLYASMAVDAAYMALSLSHEADEAKMIASVERKLAKWAGSRHPVV